MEYRNPGDTFEIDGTWYVIVEQGRKLPDTTVRVYPQPTNVPEEYIHRDGTVHICKDIRCPNLVPRSMYPGIDRLYCSRQCAVWVAQRRHDAKRDGKHHEERDMMGRLYEVAVRKQVSVKKSREVFEEHLDELKEGRCAEANQASNFHCPGRFNPNCYSQTTWSRYHQGGPWPGACLIYAVLKDHYKTMYYAERAQTTERVYTTLRGGCYRWKDEDDMLPLPEGIGRR